jgi:hypothetical protein
VKLQQKPAAAEPHLPQAAEEAAWAAGHLVPKPVMALVVPPAAQAVTSAWARRPCSLRRRQEGSFVAPNPRAEKALWVEEEHQAKRCRSEPPPA